MQTMELFAGAGGLALGGKNAGFDTRVMIEFDRHSCQTLRLNFGETAEVIEDDVRNIPFMDYRDNIDVLTGGPPCQPFSIGGKAKGNSDHRNMFPPTIAAVRDIAPKAFIFENVRGLLRASFSKYFEYIILQLNYPELEIRPHETWENHLTRLEDVHVNGRYDGLRYNVLYRLLNAADYGVPQKRERVFIVGFRSDIQNNWHFPEPTHSESALHFAQYVTGEYWDKHQIQPKKKPTLKIQMPGLFDQSLFAPWVTVRDAIAGLPDPRFPFSSDIKNHVFQAGAKAYPGHTGSSLDEPSKTLKAGDHGVPGGENMIILDDSSLRYLTVRESARIQTFPDHFEFPVSWTESMRQIGNAVPVGLAFSVASSVHKTLQNHFVKQNGN